MSTQGNRVYISSLADQLRLDTEQPPPDVPKLVEEPKNTTVTQPVDRMELGESAMNAIRHKKALAKELELQTKAQKLIVPTDDAQVRKRLRAYGEPITLFGEGPTERRDRLRMIMATRGEARVNVEEDQMDQDQEQEEQTEAFYTLGPKLLPSARMFIARYSLEQASKRLNKQKEIYNSYVESKQDAMTEKPDEIPEEVTKKKNFFAQIKTFANVSSEVGDVRPLSSISISNHSDASDRQHVLTGSWTGMVKLWSLEDCKSIRSYKAHEERITGVALNPAVNNVHFATGGADGVAKLWKYDRDQDKELIPTDNEKPLATLNAHASRLGKIAFHPSGSYLGTTGFDCTWCFWDVARGQLLCEQKGHSMAVYSIAFHPDGSLACTTDLGGIALLWDLRTGGTIMPLQGHVHQILSVDFSPNGFNVVTGSNDHTCKVWDLRTKKCVYSVPAHNKLISHVQYEPTHGRYFMTSSYDMTIKLWNSIEFKLVKTIKEMDSLILCAHLNKTTSNRDVIVTGGYDKTWKCFKIDEIN
ncbi:U4/U6 small nuclear ribonucleoprotein PRP4 [Acrasis kona]|uniref:U4/U6 small nuclear ribonucleoprotein PRP4 n=1 Tax=Acrasis kona TaxID=1008807 RepID=A0AAW2YLX2_9EUKA